MPHGATLLEEGGWRDFALLDWLSAKCFRLEKGIGPSKV